MSALLAGAMFIGANCVYGGPAEAFVTYRQTDPQHQAAFHGGRFPATADGRSAPASERPGRD
jgi:hypothetical protein